MLEKDKIADRFGSLTEMSTPKINTNEASRITTEQNYFLLVTFQGIFASSFGLIMTAAPSMFGFIDSSGVYDEYTQDSIRCDWLCVK